MIDTIADDDRNDRVTILTTPQSSRIRHCEGGAADEAIQIRGADSGLARYARNDGHESRRFADPPNLPKRERRGWRAFASTLAWAGKGA
jgi:hypothetical protein